MKLWLVMFFVVLFHLQLAAGDWRSLESNDGRELEARILSFDGETVRIQTRSRDVFPVPLSRFSEETIAKVEKWQREIGSQLTTPDDLRDNFVKSLEEGIRIRENDLPLLQTIFRSPGLCIRVRAEELGETFAGKGKLGTAGEKARPANTEKF